MIYDENKIHFLFMFKKVSIYFKIFGVDFF